MTIDEYFDRIIVINLLRRTDRWEHCLSQFETHGITNWQRFEGFDMPKDGNRGCTESHASVLRLIIENGWGRTLILEDDFEFRFENAQELFTEFIGQVPGDWWMLYLGGHFGNRLNTQVSKNVIRFGHMKTTSSYGVTLKAATTMAPHVYGAAPIDEVYLQWHQSKPCYIFTPRLCVQYESYSDLQERICNNTMCMEDTLHEDELRGVKRFEPPTVKQHDVVKPLPPRDGRVIRY